MNRQWRTETVMGTETSVPLIDFDPVYAALMPNCLAFVASAVFQSSTYVMPPIESITRMLFDLK